MSQPAQKAAVIYRRNRVPLCFCPQCIAADPSREEKRRQALNGDRIAEMRKRRPR